MTSTGVFELISWFTSLSQTATLMRRRSRAGETVIADPEGASLRIECRPASRASAPSTKALYAPCSWAAIESTLCCCPHRLLSPRLRPPGPMPTLRACGELASRALDGGQSDIWRMVHDPKLVDRRSRGPVWPRLGLHRYPTWPDRLRRHVAHAPGHLCRRRSVTCSCALE